MYGRRPLRAVWRIDPVSPTARSLAFLRRSGFIAAAVERWLAQAGIRQDLWQFGDILAAHPVRREILIVQATTLGHVAHRLAKARARPELAAWIRAGGSFAVWGWYCRAGKWQVKQVAVDAEDLAAVVLEAPARRPRSRAGPGLFDGLVH